MKTKTAILGLAAIALMPCTILANTTVFWGGPVEGIHIDSDGGLLTAPEFTFQIGAFAGGFNPAVAPYETWSDAWKVFDQAIYDNDNQFIDSTALMDVNGKSNGNNADSGFDFRGSKLYMWTYNSKVVDAGSALSLQWALISGVDWNLPLITPEGHALPLEFRLGNADQAWIGAVDPENGPPVVGSRGIYTTDEAYDLRTHGLYAAVPEPSSALLGIFGLGTLLVRRNRKS